jgi:hypothetical protein
VARCHAARSLRQAEGLRTVRLTSAFMILAYTHWLVLARVC